ncbi:hypothetical protein INR49_017258 [Caranx melampygus]|nr:hypothetical protein INR49_017258 [Caranx melampygus]
MLYLKAIHNLEATEMKSGVLFSGLLFLPLPPRPPFKELLVGLLWLKTRLLWELYLPEENCTRSKLQLLEL